MLIPIRLPVWEWFGKPEKLDYYDEKELICWYLPSPEFFNGLPGRLQNDIRREYEQIKDAKAGTSITNSTCTYFDVC